MLQGIERLVEGFADKRALLTPRWSLDLTVAILGKSIAQLAEILAALGLVQGFAPRWQYRPLGHLVGQGVNVGLRHAGADLGVGSCKELLQNLTLGSCHIANHAAYVGTLLRLHLRVLLDQRAAPATNRSHQPAVHRQPVEVTVQV